MLSLQPADPAVTVMCRYALWFRIDQKSCLKSISSAGLTPIVLENVLEGDEIRTDMSALEAAVARLSADSICCVVSTTRCACLCCWLGCIAPQQNDDVVVLPISLCSCFAPRDCDTVTEIAEFCKNHGIGACVRCGVRACRCLRCLVDMRHSPRYQQRVRRAVFKDLPQHQRSTCTYMCHNKLAEWKECSHITCAVSRPCVAPQACRVGRVDAVVQSTDKNFMVYRTGSSQVRMRFST